MDVLETQSFIGIVLLQTVLEELRNRSLPLYNRARTMAKNEDKRVYTFHNDFRMETYIVRDAGETINDRNDRGSCSTPETGLIGSNTASGAVVQGAFTVYPGWDQYSGPRNRVVNK
jgi:hypothetical protein